MTVRLGLSFLASAATLAAAVTPVPTRFTARELAQGYSDTVVLVRPRSPTASLDAAEAGEGLKMLRRYRRLGGLRALQVPSGETADQAIARLRSTGRYAYVERNWLRHAFVVPNDPSFSQQWSLLNTGQGGGTAGDDIGATAAWNTRTDASSVTVAVIDTGARLTQADLVGNLWTSSTGTHGINSTVSSGNPNYGVPNDDNTDGHGTHVSGTIGAVGNNGTAVSGVAWQVRLMELKFLDSSGSGTTADEIECIDYAIANGADIINASYGGGPYSSSEFDALAAARDAGIIVVAAAGNDTADNDLVTDYPSGYALDNIVAVAASTNTDALAYYSNYGSGSVELAAPGGDGTTAGGILSLSNASDTGTRTLSGTSMATPHVVGTLALLKAEFPGDTYRQLINRLLRSVTKKAAFAGEVQTGGRLSVAAALATTTNRPFNDDFADRAVIAGSLVNVRSNNAGATVESGEPSHAGVSSSASLWWSWTAPGDTNVKITTSGSDYDTVLAVYTGTSLPGLQSVAANDDANGTTQSEVTFTATAGTTYQIAVAGKNGATGYTALALTAPPANDDFANATTLTGVSVSAAGSNLNASEESNEPDPTRVGAGNTVWYRWTAPVSGQFVLSAFSTQIDTVAAVYTGSSLASLSVVGSNDSPAANSANTDAQVVFTAAAGTTYFFQIDNRQSSSQAGSFILTLADAVWEYPASDEVTTPPAVATDGTVYFGAGSASDTDRKVYALNPDGSMKWSYNTLSSGEGIEDSAPVVGSDGTVYIGATDSRFYALNPSSGFRKWSFTATSAIGSSAALASDGTIYFRDNTTLYSLTAGGAKKWSFALTGSTADGTYCSPSVAADGTIYVGTNGGNFYAVNPDGTQKWTYTADGDIFTSPTIAGDGTIYFATLNGTVYALSPAGAKLWSWSTSDHSSITSSIALGAGGTLYFAGYDHKLHALSGSGSALWAYDLGDEVRASSPAVASDGTIYIGCYDGFVYAINSNGTLQRTYATAQTVRSSPVIAGHRLYFGSADAKLHAFDITPSLLAGDWPMFHQNQFHTGLAAGSGGVAPAITTQPASQTATVGDNVTFTVAASGTAPLGYQWRAGGTNIPGATGASLILTGITTANATTYDVVVTNSAGSVTSNPATLTVNKAAATVTLGSLAQTYDGSSHAASATTTPSGLSVTFTYNGSSTHPVNAGSYAVVGTVNDPNYTGSASGTLVIAKAALTATADNKTKVQGSPNPTLTISYTGFATGDTTAVLDTPPSISTTATTGSSPGNYPITLSGGSDNNYTFTLVNGTLTVSAATPPSITTPPASQTATVGDNVTFTVAASGTAPLGYQWRAGGTNIPGATGTSLTLTGITTANATTYDVVVTNSAGSVTSNAATLTVNKAAATVTLGRLSQTYNGLAHTITVTTVPADLTVAVTYNGGSNAPTDAGSYAVTATVNNPDYAGSASGTLVVAKAALTATADDQTRIEGTANPVLTITYAGFVGGDTAADLDTPPAIATTATTDSPPGSYPISLTGGSDNDYTFTLVNGTLTVTALPVAPAITRQPVSQSAAVGANATFSVEVTGTAPLHYQWFKNGAALTGATSSSFTIDSVQDSDAATYTVTVTNSLGSAASRPAALTLSGAAGAPVITTQPLGAGVAAGSDVTLTVVASSDTPLTYQWRMNGADLGGATGSSLHLTAVQPVDAGAYTVAVTNTAGTTVSDPAIVGASVADKVSGDGSVVGSNIVHPNGNVYDQVLLTGTTAAITADAGQVTRLSFIDLKDNIVQVEFAGHGTLTVTLDEASGPAAPVNYNQPGVLYMKGLARIVIVGADETTNVSVFTVGRATAFDPTGAYNFLLPPGPSNDPANNGSPLFSGHAATVYDGLARIASISIQSADGKFGGVRTADASYSSSSGLTGLYAPGVAFTGPVYLENLEAFATATPVILVGSVTDAAITGGNLFQDNGAVVQVSGLTTLDLIPGTDSGGALLPNEPNRGVLEDNGQDVTSTIIPPSAGG